VRQILGLDLGPNSIGWSLVLEQEKNVSIDITAGGVRIFQEAVDAKTRTPKNQARRVARLTRRVIQRRAKRKRKLTNYLISIGWLPGEMMHMPEPERWFNATGNAYELRKKGLDEALSLEEFSRVMLHMCARRGFLSNRKIALIDFYNSDDPDVLSAFSDDGNDEQEYLESADLSPEDKDEQTAFEKEITDLRDDIDVARARTLGEFLASLPYHQRKRARRTDRRMYQSEFELLWKVQQEFSPEVFTVERNLACYEIIFFQRPLKLRKNRRGKCSLETSRYRCAKAKLEAQEFRLLQDINHLSYTDRTTGEWVQLSNEQKDVLCQKLESQGTMAWSAARKLLGLNNRVKFNLERSKKKLQGNITVAKLRKVDSEFWKGLGDIEKGAFVEDLLTIRNRYAAYLRLIRVWKLSKTTALSYAQLEFEPGFAHLSMKALRRLLPYMRQGQMFSEARVLSGYGYESPDADLRATLGEPPEARNPVVQKALYEVRKLVNAIIRVHGKPVAVRVEMARELKLTPKQKKQQDKQKRLNEKLNSQAADEYAVIREKNPHLNLPEWPSRDDKMRYRLWREQSELCVYTGKSIGLTELWTAEIEVDHVLPYSRTLNDSYMNKVVCAAQANRDKSNKTPYEYWGGDEGRFDEIRQRLRNYPDPKKGNIERKELDKIDDFISRQLNDTRYISRLVLGYLKTTFADVSVSTGAGTAYLRKQWGLNSILSDTGEKTRADHRHHFIDAVTVGLTNRRTYQSMAHVASRSDMDSGYERLSRLRIDAPIVGLRGKVQKIADEIFVSHAINRKLRGALHEDTFRGIHKSGYVTKRIPVDSGLKASDVARVIDPDLKKFLEGLLDEHGGNEKAAFSEPIELGGGRLLRHVKIRSAKPPKPGVYLELKNARGDVQRRAIFGNTHHVEIYRNAKGKHESRFVTTFDAARRARRKRFPIIDRLVPDDATFLFALHINDTVKITLEGKASYYRVQKFARDANALTLRCVRASTLKNSDEMLRKSITALMDQYKMCPVEVDPLGRLHQID